MCTHFYPVLTLCFFSDRGLFLSLFSFQRQEGRVWDSNEESPFTLIHRKTETIEKKILLYL